MHKEIEMLSQIASHYIDRQIRHHWTLTFQMVLPTQDKSIHSAPGRKVRKFNVRPSARPWCQVTQGWEARWHFLNGFRNFDNDPVLQFQTIVIHDYPLPYTTIYVICLVVTPLVKKTMIVVYKTDLAQLCLKFCLYLRCFSSYSPFPIK